MLWVDYKIFSYLMLGPRYIYEVKSLYNALEGKPYYEKVAEIVNILNTRDDNILKTEYTSCLVNDYKHLKCPPYESWYREKTLYGKSTQEVLEYYTKYKIIPQKQVPDHISTEFEFVSFLFFINEENDANDFIKTHILNWVPQLAQDIINNAYGEYTRELGKALLAFVNEEKKRIFSNN
ncbi:TorD/DmsD family molecular chaperone [Acidianus brierleyi]|uniref:Cytoplasmic chaperone TorD family protein n=1 Tax=Acidianus brierleyi TaxID=41673 RepID=A0A2U9ICR2_9CREN|nr:molecular chaperone TorD family protein [Acidianus brierleyi]AWR93803.1 hypothetical protein DFR85_03410 [Acidianus brierleyi]